MAGSGRAAVATARSAGLGGSGQPHARRRQQSQGQQRSASQTGRRGKEKKKVNCKPKNQDEQEIPFRLREIMRSRQEMKKPLSNKKRKKEAQVAFRKTLEKEAKGEEPDIIVPKFKQRKGESDVAYIQRMEQEAQHVLFLSKNQATRQPEVQAAPRKEKSERKKAFQKRRLEKAQKKKEARAVERLEQELLTGISPQEAQKLRPPCTSPGLFLRSAWWHLWTLPGSLLVGQWLNTVKFGEVVLQPPELTVQPRRSISRDVPGKKPLMLKMLLGPGGVSPTPATSLARQRILGEERARAVQAYRALKKLQRQEVTPAQPPGSSSQRKLQTCL
ncbi:coiled-coil domain-containing protein 137 isoform X1 [Onychomys torridus]|uniref:coiled-coil domain-containing protein 137 isoform X1 n=1 Tax=Onychomys torridus TaxID=38674 RepID=UPI00167F7A2D|nr:coiled-coil domain-containing protein 137 isoform X1 [Onychomys torridus]